MTVSLEQTKLSLKLVKNEIEKFKFKQGSLIEKIQRKESSRQWLVEQRAFKYGADLVQLNLLIRDTALLKMNCHSNTFLRCQGNRLKMTSLGVSAVFPSVGDTCHRCCENSKEGCQSHIW